MMAWRLTLLALIVTLISAITFASEEEEGTVVNTGKLEEVDPGYGPRAGGTRVTLKGRHLHEPDQGDIVTVNLREAGDIYSCTTIDSSRSDLIVVLTPAYRGADDSVELVLEIRNRTTGIIKQTHRSTFNYRPDPTVQRLQPHRTILAGGVTLTVNGRYLDSVARPQVTSTVLRAGRAVQTLNDQQAYFVNATHAKFRLPAVPVPADDSIHEVTLLVGVLFDSITYPNYTQLTVVNNPTVEPWSPRELQFSQGNDEFIRVNVTWPGDEVISADDVIVMVGTRRCLELTFNSTEIRCEPPPVPEPTIRNGPETISKPLVVVRIGHLETQVGKIIYSIPEGIHIIIIIMSSILILMFLIAFVFGCIACCSGRKRDKKPSVLPQERSSISYVPVDDLDEMARRRSRIRLSKDSIVDLPPQNYQRVRSNSSTSSSTTGAGAGDKSDQVTLQKIEERKEPAGGPPKVVFTDMSK